MRKPNQHDSLYAIGSHLTTRLIWVRRSQQELLMKPTILALDLEGTLISNAVSQIPRPGLYRFLEDVRSQFEELVLFTTVPEALARSIAGLLVTEGSVPAWFSGLRYTHWSGKTKDLSYVSPHLGDALLLDDHGPYVHDGQESLWVEIPLFAAPYSADDDGLQIAAARLTDRIMQLESASNPARRTEGQLQ